MMADSIEHVISYWIIFQKFHSPALGGFAVLSHWLPFLFFSVYSGALADRFDPRRIIQLAMNSSMPGWMMRRGSKRSARAPECTAEKRNGSPCDRTAKPPSARG